MAGVGVVEELTKGRKSAVKLMALLDSVHSPGRDALDLVGEISNSLARSISFLKAAEATSERKLQLTGKRRQDQDPTGRKISRRKVHAASTRQVVSTTADDEHSWRKYGQKEILKSKFPRSYFRCSNKYDQGCQATKRVQEMEGDLLEITYFGEHTCNNNGTNKSGCCMPELLSSSSFTIKFEQHDHVPSLDKPSTPISSSSSLSHDPCFRGWSCDGFDGEASMVEVEGTEVAAPGIEDTMWLEEILGGLQDYSNGDDVATMDQVPLSLFTFDFSRSS